jgi:hypothetical protein
MSILDQLVEKKDIFAYIEARTQDLLIQQTKIDSLPEYKREFVKQKLAGRIAELDHLRIVLSSGRLKDQAKHHWRNVHVER